MKSRLALFFLVFYMIATTQVAQVLRVPLFVEHYMEYTQGGLIHFVIHHYGGHEVDEDWDIDQKLPFMNPSKVISVVATVPLSTIPLIDPSIEVICKKVKLLYKDQYSTLFGGSIFQPPRIC